MKTTKICFRCKNEKSISEFCKQSSHKDGLSSWCRNCKAKIQKIYMQSEKGKQTRKALVKRTKPYQLFHITRSKCRKSGKEFDLDIPWFEKRFKKGCELTGLPFNVNIEGYRAIDSLSIDRIDPLKGYVKSNCRLILWGLNAFKAQFTDEEMYKVASAFVSKYQCRDKTQKV